MKQRYVCWIEYEQHEGFRKEVTPKNDLKMALIKGGENVLIKEMKVWIIGRIKRRDKDEKAKKGCFGPYPGMRRRYSIFKLSLRAAH
jgi:hypothetical protein